MMLSGNLAGFKINTYIYRIAFYILLRPSKLSSGKITFLFAEPPQNVDGSRMVVPGNVTAIWLSDSTPMTTVTTQKQNELLCFNVWITGIFRVHGRPVPGERKIKTGRLPYGCRNTLFLLTFTDHCRHGTKIATMWCITSLGGEFKQRRHLHEN